MEASRWSQRRRWRGAKEKHALYYACFLAGPELATGGYAAAGGQLHQALEIAYDIQFLSLVPKIVASAGELLLQAGRTERGAELLRPPLYQLSVAMPFASRLNC